MNSSPYFFDSSFVPVGATVVPLGQFLVLGAGHLVGRLAGEIRFGFEVLQVFCGDGKTLFAIFERGADFVFLFRG
jgi:hypothetical protein